MAYSIKHLCWKRIIILSCFSFIQILTIAQGVNKEITFNETSDSQSFKLTGVYLAPEIKGGNIANDFSYFLGGKIGLIYNEKISFGVAYYGLLHNNIFGHTIIENESEKTISIELMYGGYNMDYSILSDKFIHINLPIIIGISNLKLYDNNHDHISYETWDLLESATAYVIEPGINAEFNLLRFLKLNCGISYRYILGAKLVNLSDKDLSGISYNVSIKLGSF